MGGIKRETAKKLCFHAFLPAPPLASSALALGKKLTERFRTYIAGLLFPSHASGITGNTLIRCHAGFLQLFRLGFNLIASNDLFYVIHTL